MQSSELDCCCCGFCAQIGGSCLHHACCRQIKRGCNTCVPGLCPDRDTRRHWRYGSSGATRARWRQYVAREHTIIGLFYAPTRADPAGRPTDLLLIQRLLLVLLKTAIELELSMLVALHFPDWVTGLKRWAAVIFVSTLAAAFKACYQTALKRTYHQVVHVAGILARGINVSGAVELRAVAHLGGAECEAHTASNGCGQTWAWAADELHVPVQDRMLEIALFQPLAETWKFTSREKKVGSISYDVGEMPLNETRQVGPLPLQDSPGGDIAFTLVKRRDEPITLEAFVSFALRPITECLILRCLLCLCCAPCCFCCRPGTARPRRRIEQSLVGRSTKLGPTSKTAAASRGFVLQASSWRRLMRFVVVVLVAAAFGSYFVLFTTGSPLDRERLWTAAILLIHAKILSWVVIEPLALSTTYWSMRVLCPCAVPRLQP